MKKWPWFLCSIVVILIDQITKHWATASLLPYYPESIAPMLNLTLVYNTGAAFSFLSGGGYWHQWFFASFSILMSLALMIWIIRVDLSDRFLLVALSLILGGALGNLVDRIRLGYVIDFIDVYYKHYHWPVFNVADSAICIGAFLLFIDLWKK